MAIILQYELNGGREPILNTKFDFFAFFWHEQQLFRLTYLINMGVYAKVCFCRMILHDEHLGTFETISRAKIQFLCVILVYINFLRLIIYLLDAGFYTKMCCCKIILQNGLNSGQKSILRAKFDFCAFPCK